LLSGIICVAAPVYRGAAARGGSGISDWCADEVDDGKRMSAQADDDLDRVTRARVLAAASLAALGDPGRRMRVP
jgi:hypothetical protein